MPPLRYPLDLEVRVQHLLLKARRKREVDYISGQFQVTQADNFLERNFGPLEEPLVIRTLKEALIQLDDSTFSLNLILQYFQNACRQGLFNYLPSIPEVITNSLEILPHLVEGLPQLQTFHSEYIRWLFYDHLHLFSENIVALHQLIHHLEFIILNGNFGYYEGFMQLVMDFEMSQFSIYKDKNQENIFFLQYKRILLMPDFLRWWSRSCYFHKFMVCITRENSSDLAVKAFLEDTLLAIDRLNISIKSEEVLNHIKWYIESSGENNLS